MLDHIKKSGISKKIEITLKEKIHDSESLIDQIYDFYPIKSNLVLILGASGELCLLKFSAKKQKKKILGFLNLFADEASNVFGEEDDDLDGCQHAHNHPLTPQNTSLEVSSLVVAKNLDYAVIAAHDHNSGTKRKLYLIELTSDAKAVNLDDQTHQKQPKNSHFWLAGLKSYEHNNSTKSAYLAMDMSFRVAGAPLLIAYEHCPHGKVVSYLVKGNEFVHYKTIPGYSSGYVFSVCVDFYAVSGPGGRIWSVDSNGILGAIEVKYTDKRGLNGLNGAGENVCVMNGGQNLKSYRECLLERCLDKTLTTAGFNDSQCEVEEPTAQLIPHAMPQTPQNSQNLPKMQNSENNPLSTFNDLNDCITTFSVVSDSKELSTSTETWSESNNSEFSIIDFNSEKFSKEWPLNDQEDSDAKILIKGASTKHTNQQCTSSVALMLPKGHLEAIETEEAETEAEAANEGAGRLMSTKFSDAPSLNSFVNLGDDSYMSARFSSEKRIFVEDDHFGADLGCAAASGARLGVREGAGMRGKSFYGKNRGCGLGLFSNTTSQKSHNMSVVGAAVEEAGGRGASGEAARAPGIGRKASKSNNHCLSRNHRDFNPFKKKSRGAKNTPLPAPTSTTISNSLKSGVNSAQNGQKNQKLKNSKNLKKGQKQAQKSLGGLQGHQKPTQNDHTTHSSIVSITSSASSSQHQASKMTTVFSQFPIESNSKTELTMTHFESFSKKDDHLLQPSETSKTSQTSPNSPKILLRDAEELQTDSPDTSNKENIGLNQGILQNALNDTSLLLNKVKRSRGSLMGFELPRFSKQSVETEELLRSLYNSKQMRAKLSDLKTSQETIDRDFDSPIKVIEETGGVCELPESYLDRLAGGSKSKEYWTSPPSEKHSRIFGDLISTVIGRGAKNCAQFGQNRACGELGKNRDFGKNRGPGMCSGAGAKLQRQPFSRSRLQKRSETPVSRSNSNDPKSRKNSENHVFINSADQNSSQSPHRAGRRESMGSLKSKPPIPSSRKKSNSRSKIFDCMRRERKLSAIRERGRGSRRCFVPNHPHTLSMERYNKTLESIADLDHDGPQSVENRANSPQMACFKGLGRVYSRTSRSAAFGGENGFLTNLGLSGSMETTEHSREAPGGCDYHQNGRYLAGNAQEADNIRIEDLNQGGGSGRHFGTLNESKISNNGTEVDMSALDATIDLETMSKSNFFEFFF